MATEAISLYIETLLEDGELIPSDESNLSAAVQISIPVKDETPQYA
jgi:predicted RNase H-like HicB family nuclease